MPSLAELTDSYPQQDNTLPVEQPYSGANLGPLQPNPQLIAGALSAPPDASNGSWLDNVGMAGVDDKSGSSEHPLLKQLFGLGGETRYQLWPEKVVREALAAPHDAMTGAIPQYAVDPNTGDVHTSPQMIEGAQAVSALAGSGGLAGTTDATLGAGPFLRPALKYENKIYKAPIGGQHLDALPEHLYNDFQQKAMNGEDINHYNFGFMNHKGQFLDREKALDYAVKEGLVDPHAGQYGALTSTLLADSSKPGTAIEAMAKTQPFYSALEHNVNATNQAKMTGDQWLGTLANKPGVKPEELDWTGVKSFLEEKGKQPVTKAELQEHLANNKVELKEVDKGGDATKEQAFALAKEHGWKSWDDIDAATQAKYLARVSKEAGDNPTKYHSYQLPGGENYREKLLTLPEKQNFEQWFRKQYSTGNYEEFEKLPEAIKQPLLRDYNK